MGLDDVMARSAAQGRAIQTPERRWRRRLARALGKTFAFVSGAYGVGLALFLLLRGLVGEPTNDWWEPVAVISSFLHLLLLPSLVLIPLALLLRRGWVALSLLPAALTFVLFYGVFFIPRAASAPPDAPQITVLTFNLHGEQQALAPLVGVIRQADAGIVALQELSSAAASAFAEALADLYPYQAFHPQTGPNAGQGVLSRYPLLADDYWQAEEGYVFSRGHQRVELEVAGTRLTLYNTHPPNPFLRRNPLAVLIGRDYSADVHRDALTDVLDRAAQDTGPVLLVGDFNMSDQNAGYGRVTARYVDTYREVGWGMGFTYPDWSDPNAAPGLLQSLGLAVYPLVRLDYLFHSDHFQGLEAQVWPTAGSSDHRPVFARLALLTNGR